MITKPLHIAELEEKIAKLLGRGGAAEAPAPVPVAAVPAPVAEAPASRPVPPSPRPGSLPSMSAAPAPTPRPGSLSSVPAAPRAAPPSSVPAPVSLPAFAAVDEPAGAKVLIVEHMEAASRALAALIPAELGVHTSRSTNEAQLKMRANAYRLVYFDIDLPVNALPALMNQLRQLQRDAVFVGVAVAKENGEPPDTKDALVFDEIVTRPFDEQLIHDLSDQFTGSFQHLVELSGENLLRVAAFRGRRPRLDAYLEQLDKRLGQLLHGLAEACVDQAVIDLLQLPPAHAARVARFAGDLLARQAALGLALRLVATPPLQEALRAQPDTKDVRCFHSVEEAQAA
jgi:DNA-binding response OmpR family regulator